MQVHDVMIPHPSVITPTDSVATAARIMQERHIRMLPVVEAVNNKTLVGIITAHDILVRCSQRGHDGHLCRVKDHMTADPLEWVRRETDVSDVTAKMAKLGYRRIPVVEGDRQLVGVISIADLEVHHAPTPVGIGGRSSEATVATSR